MVGREPPSIMRSEQMTVPWTTRSNMNPHEIAQVFLDTLGNRLGEFVKHIGNVGCSIGNVNEIQFVTGSRHSRPVSGRTPQPCSVEATAVTNRRSAVSMTAPMRCASAR